MTQLKEVTKSTPCPHCGKPDWCYCLEKLSVCKRKEEPAPGWKATSKHDQEGDYYYAPNERTTKKPRAAQKRIWNYPNRDGGRFVRVVRLDDGEGGKKVWQEYWNGKRWVKNLKDVNRADIPIYRYAEIREVISSGDKQDQINSHSPQETSSGDSQSQNTKRSQQKTSSGNKQSQNTKCSQRETSSGDGQNQSTQSSPQNTDLGKTIFIVEGETCADLLWEWGIPATTNIGGSGKWRKSDSADLKGAKFVVLCPDRDTPGVKHMEKISKDFPNAQWLYAFPHSGLWHNLPKSKGLDLVDWIEDYQLDAQEILESVGEKRELKQHKKLKSEAKPSEDDFKAVIEEINKVQAIKCPGERKWEMAKLARKYKTRVSLLMDAYYSARENQPIFDGKTIKELLEATPERFDWLIAGLMPMASTALLYAEAGTGKTLLANSLIKAVAGGEDWNGYPTKQGKVLYIQTDEPAINTAHNLKEAGFASIPEENLKVFFEWQFEQMLQLEEEIEKEQPELVVIDSLTSSNRTATTEEKSVEYARGLYELRDISMKYGCAIIVLHHENKNGGVRGSTAIKANVSEVWHLTKSDKLSREHRLLEVEKSRSGCIGTRQLFLDTYDLSWEDQGDFDPTQHGEKGEGKKLPISARLLAFLQERPGVKFEPIELVGDFGKNKEAVRKTLARLYKSGLIEFETREKTTANGNKSKYKVYFFPEMSDSPQTPTTQGLELSDKLSDKLPDKSDKKENVQQVVQQVKASENKGSEAVGQIEKKKSENFSQKTKNTEPKNQETPLDLPIYEGASVTPKSPEDAFYNLEGTVIDPEEGTEWAWVQWDNDITNRVKKNRLRLI